jgi:glutathione synthase/RimK-type ligase-like ATP-grasp enzyme
MKVYLAHKEQSFSCRWLELLVERKVQYEIIDPFSQNVPELISSPDIFLWHWGPEEASFALALTIALEKKGVRVYPNFSTCWHFDNKVAQHYLFQACDIQVIQTWVFHSRKEALEWSDSVKYPVVFKLSGGASATNVQLVHSKQKVKMLIRRAFGRGFRPINRWSLFKNQIWKFERDKTIRSFLGIINGFRLLFVGKPIENIRPREKGFVYFQKFVPENEYDTRVVVIGDRCFAVRRYNRSNDFRASGSGRVDYSPQIFDTRLFDISFKLADQIGMQSMACDYVFSPQGSPLLIEVSYGFITGSFYESCEGYWDRNLKWHNYPVRPETFILEDMLDGFMET